MCDHPDCDSDPCIYDDSAQEGMKIALMCRQVEEGYFN